MTLHWWMHWFWVTALLMLLSSRDARAFPQSEELQHMTTGAEPPPGAPAPPAPPAPAHRPGERRAKAIYPQGKPALLVTTPRPPDSKLYMESLSDRKIVDKPAPLPENKHSDVRVEQLLRYAEPANDSASVLAPVADAAGFNSSETSTNTSVTDLQTPSNKTKLQESTPDRVSNASQATAANRSTWVIPRLNVTGHELTAADAESPAESEPLEPEASRIVTEKPWSLETTLIERSPAAGNQVQASRERAMRPPQPDGMDTGAIAGISFAALALAALAGTTAFVLYRRRYLNKPQTLNDKCSNPDSSGYLDDSTIRENSEEMYSLDNDSFLNSLEAMTIQNYWTDNVKHSKL